MPSTHSSGDPIADRRFDYALAYRQGGDLAAAIELIQQALDRAPNWAAGWTTLGEWHEARGEVAAAVSAYRRSLSIDATDVSGAVARLARLGQASAAGAVSQAHIAALFDDYAPRFEKSLVEGLGYRAPALLHEAVMTPAPDRRFQRLIDLGCGTGLSGEAFADLCETMVGVDLSPAMLAIAAGKRLYTRLVQGDIVDFLTQQPASSVDLVLAADVFVYVGDLSAVFGQVARVLTPAGMFAFTVQHHDGDRPFVIGEDLRYAHAVAVLQDWAKAAGLAIVHLASASTRLDAGKPVPGTVAVLRRDIQTGTIEVA